MFSQANLNLFLPRTEQEERRGQEPEEKKNTSKGTYSIEEVAKHNKKDDCWVMIVRPCRLEGKTELNVCLWFSILERRSIGCYELPF